MLTNRSETPSRPAISTMEPRWRCFQFHEHLREGLSGGERGLVRVPGLLSHAPAQRIAGFETCPLCVLIFEHQKFWEKFARGSRLRPRVAVSRNVLALV